MIIICLLILGLMVANSSLVIRGASTGLMLWYRNVLPILLPFMLVSNILVDRLWQKRESTGKRQAVFLTIISGLFCGYPVGAKVSTDFTRAGFYSVQTADLLLPVINNSSPMFISGFIISSLFQGRLSFFYCIFIIYAPYILYILAAFSITHFIKKETVPTLPVQKAAIPSTDFAGNAISGITYVGFYIMLCSILCEFILSFSFLPALSKPIASGIVEITCGTKAIADSVYFPGQIKKALILAMTSWGGLSSILQTNKVISQSGLSIYRYVLVKFVCAAASFGLALLV